jgi:hypothetical protein
MKKNILKKDKDLKTPVIDNRFSNSDTNPEFNEDLIEIEEEFPADEFDFISDENIHVSNDEEKIPDGEHP